MADEAPVILNDRYALHARIARGGMADVLLARDELLQRPVAVKMLFPEFAADPSFVERFRREAQSAAALNHPGIVGVYDWGEQSGTYYIVMEYVEGRSLAEVLRADGAMSDEESARVARDVARALGAAHAREVVHRDVKPGNVLIDGEGSVKVTDFGIARAVSGTADDDLTRTGAVMGTATYLSPEQAQGFRVDQRSDLYSLGVVLFEMVTGRPPFGGESPVAIAYKHVQNRPPLPRQVNPDVDPGLEAVILKLLAKKPDQRYGDAGAAAEDLDRFVRGETTAAERELERARRAAQARKASAAGGAPVVRTDSSEADASTSGQDRQGAEHTGPGERSVDGERESQADAGAGVIPVVGGLGMAAGAAAASDKIGIANATTGEVELVREGENPTISMPVTRPESDRPRSREAVPTESKGRQLVPAQRPVPSRQPDAQHDDRRDVAAAATPKGGLSSGVLAVGGLVAAVAIGVLAWVLIGFLQGGSDDPVDGGVVAMPELAGGTLEDARARLLDDGFVIDDEHFGVEERSDEAPVNQVLEQDPAAGVEVDPEGAFVTLTVSSGVELITIEDVSNSTTEAAERALMTQGFEVATVGEESEVVEEGRAIRTEPPQGTMLALNSRVTLFVSGGSGTSPIPCVGGMSPEEAEAELNDANLDVTVRSVDSEDVDEGLVIGTDPECLTEVGPRSEVFLLVSSGVADPVVPVLIQTDEDEASSRLTELGYEVQVTAQATDDPDLDGVITSQDPSGNTRLERGGTVRITVLTYTAPTTLVPDTAPPVTTRAPTTTRAPATTVPAPASTEPAATTTAAG